MSDDECDLINSSQVKCHSDLASRLHNDLQNDLYDKQTEDHDNVFINIHNPSDKVSCAMH